MTMRVRYYPPRAGNELRPAGNSTQDMEGLTWRCWCQGSSTLDAPGSSESSRENMSYQVGKEKRKKKEQRGRK